jgi:recombination protein RecA
MDQNKRALIDAALARIEKSHGKGVAMYGESQPTENVEVIPSGCIALDVALGVGGWPRGRIVEIYGPESSGKTTLTLHAIAQCQAAGGVAAFIDAEHAIDPDYARKLGVNFDELVISQPDNGEQALEILDTLVRSEGIDLIVVDSVAALVPRAEIEGEMGDAHVGLQARLMSQALRKITGALKNSNTTAIFINQLREKIGGMSYGNNETTTGGKALKFYASVRIDIRRIGALKQGEDVIGNQTKIKVAKNKVSAPFKVITTEIYYGEGISRAGEILDLGEKNKCGVTKSGAWYYYTAEGDSDKVALGQGKENARQFLKDNPGLADEIERRIRTALGMLPVVDAPFDDDPVDSPDDEAAASAAA